MRELAGLVKCAKCGYAIKVNHPPNLSCHGRNTLHICDASIQIKFPILQESVAVEIQKQLDKIASKILRNSISRKKEQDKISQINEEIERLVKLAAMGTMDIEQVHKAIEERKQKIDEIKLPALVYSRLTEEEKKSAAQLLIKKLCFSFTRWKSFITF